MPVDRHALSEQTRRYRDTCQAYAATCIEQLRAYDEYECANQFGIDSHQLRFYRRALTTLVRSLKADVPNTSMHDVVAYLCNSQIIPLTPKQCQSLTDYPSCHHTTEQQRSLLQQLCNDLYSTVLSPVLRSLFNQKHSLSFPFGESVFATGCVSRSRALV